MNVIENKSVGGDAELIKIKLHDVLQEWFSTKGDFAISGEHLAKSGDILHCHKWGDRVMRAPSVEARDVAENHTVYKSAPHNKELPKCQ